MGEIGVHSVLPQARRVASGSRLGGGGRLPLRPGLFTAVSFRGRPRHVVVRVRVRVRLRVRLGRLAGQHRGDGVLARLRRVHLAGRARRRGPLMVHLRRRYSPVLSLGALRVALAGGAVPGHIAASAAVSPPGQRLVVQAALDKGRRRSKPLVAGPQDGLLLLLRAHGLALPGSLPYSHSNAVSLTETRAFSWSWTNQREFPAGSSCSPTATSAAASGGSRCPGRPPAVPRVRVLALVPVRAVAPGAGP